MGTRVQGRLTVAAALLLGALTYAQVLPRKPDPPGKPADAPAKETPKRVIPAPLPALSLPGKPSLTGKRPPTVPPEKGRPGGAGPQVEDKETRAATAARNHQERQQREIAKAAAPLDDFALRFRLWQPPHGTYLNKLRERILRADAEGNNAERDRLLSIYQPWAEKYLNPDSATWSRDKLRPGGKTTKAPKPDKPAAD